MKLSRSTRTQGFCASALIAATLMFGIAAPASAEGVGIVISLGQPSFYGRIDLGDMQRPPVVYRSVRIVERRSPHARGEPLYLRVPTSHQRNWRRYCGRYDACGHPVYFVRDSWYREQYVPHYEARQARLRGDGHGRDERDHRHDERDHDRRDQR